MGKKLSSFYVRGGVVPEAAEAVSGAYDGYEAILREVRQYVSEHYAGALQATLESAVAKKALYDIILQCVAKKELIYRDYTPEDLADRLIADMAGYGFLEPLLYDDNVEEIRGNSWDDIEVVYAGKRAVKYPECFRNPHHAMDIIKKMVRLGGYQLDESTPDVDSFFMRGIRISAWIPPVVDDDVGVAFVIRRQRRVKISEEELLQGTASLEELDFLLSCLAHGVAIVIAGETGCGKTTLLEWLLSRLIEMRTNEDKDDQVRILTMEESRELDLVRRDASGRPISSVIHTRTRESNDDRYIISQNHLLKRFMRFTPDVIAVAEMRGEEAYTAISSALSGHAVVSSIHAGSVEKAIQKIMMYARESDISRGFADAELRQLITDAFPIVCYMEQMEDDSRKILGISEVAWADCGAVFRTLFRYDCGRHMCCGSPSDTLVQKLAGYGGCSL